MKSGKLIRLLIIVLIICVMNSTTFVHISQAAFPPGFDQSRIRLETKIGHKVVLQFDQIELYGTLIRQVPISEQELEELIRQTMEDMGIDSLERLNEIVNKADQWEEITDDEIMQLLRDLVTTITTVEAFGPYPQDLVTIIDKLRTNDFYGAQRVAISMGMTLDAMIMRIILMLEDILSQMQPGDGLNDLFYQAALKEFGLITGTRTKVGNALGYLYYLYFLYGKHMQDVQKFTERAEAAMAKAWLNAFYEELQRRIDYTKNQKREDDTYWVINFDKATGQRHNFSFFGVGGNNQTWELTMRLQQTEQTGEFSFDSGNVAGSAAGTYEGEYTIKTDSDLTAFAAFPQESIMNIGVHGDNMLWNISITKQLNPNNEMYVEPMSQGIAQNTRILKGRCSAYVHESGEIQLHVEPGKEEIRNSFKDIIFVIHEVSRNGLTGEFLYHSALDAEIKAIPDEKKVYVTYADTGYFVEGNPEYDWDAVKWNLAEGLEIGALFDNEDLIGEPDYYDWDESEIWKPWDESIKTMRIVK